MWRLPAPSFSSSSTSTLVPDKHESPTRGPAFNNSAAMCMTVYIYMPHIIIQRLTGFYSTFYVWKNQTRLSAHCKENVLTDVRLIFRAPVSHGPLEPTLAFLRQVSRVKLGQKMKVLLFTGAHLSGICLTLVQCTMVVQYNGVFSILL